MPTPTYDLIASNVLGSATASVTFSSIPATYRDLVLVATATSSSNDVPFIRFNSDSSSIYSGLTMNGDGGTAYSSTQSSPFSYAGFWNSQITTDATLAKIQIMDYSATDKHKTFISRLDQAIFGRTAAYAHRFGTTTAISSLTFSMLSGTFSAGSSFYLYGIVS